jgi:hypothetical protein
MEVPPERRVFQVGIHAGKRTCHGISSLMELALFYWKVWRLGIARCGGQSYF